MYSTLQFIVSQLNQQGITTTDIISDTGIIQEVIDDPWPYLGTKQYHRLVANIIRLTGDKAIGLNLSSHFKARHMGVAGYAALTSETFADARKVIMKYRVLKDPYIYLSHNLDNHSWRISLAGVYPAEEYVTRFSIEGHIVRTAQFCADLTGHNHSLQTINLSYPPPPYADLYHQVLPCPIHFNQPENSIAFDHRVLNQPLPAADATMFKLCTNECDTQLAQLDAQSAFKNKVYQEIYRAHSKDNHCLLSLHEVADRLYISSRTLRRKLQSEESNFQQICNEVRKDLSTYYLSNSNLSAKEIAYLLGYSSVNNFHRAFKQWTGKPVSEFLR